MMLTGGGFRVKLASSGQEALDALAGGAPNAIALALLDVSMPGMSARDLRARLRATAPRMKVVYFTGYAYEATDPEDAVLEKPVTERKLLETIREVLDRA